MRPRIRKFLTYKVTKVYNKTIFFTHLIHFLYQNLKQFPQVLMCSVSKIQRSNSVVSSYRLISKAIFRSFTQQNDVTLWCGGVVFLLQCRGCSQSVPIIRSLSRRPKDCTGGGGGAYPSCSMTYMSLHLATLACGS
jgi:hypothetical protein